MKARGAPFAQDDTGSCVTGIVGPEQLVLLAGFFGFEAALLGEERHRRHQVLYADDADNFAAFGDGNQ